MPVRSTPAASDRSCGSGRAGRPARGCGWGSVATAGRARDHGSALSGAMARAVARLWGAYALNVYLPGSASARRLRNPRRALPARMAFYLTEPDKRDGTVSRAALALGARAAAATRPGTIIVEIGTFDG